MYSLPKDFSNPFPKKKTFQVLSTRACYRNIDKEFEPTRGIVITGLQTLPTEILLHIQSHLPPSSKVLLNHVHRRFYRSLDYSMEDFVSEYAQPRIRSIFLDPSERDAAHSKLSELSKLLCMLDRDHLIRKSRAVCGVCCSVHQTSLFSTTELQKDSTIRQCLGREGRLWVCPHTVLSYDDLSDF